MEESRLLDQVREALAAHYDVERVLGHGGMGMVVLGRDRALDRAVAIKVISPEIDVTPRHRQRFLQEARIVAKLRHPNIVAVYAVGEANGLLYFVMEYVPGESLRELLARDRCCAPERTARILRDLADALAFAHARGVVHRDIKPENVLLDQETGRAMLTDFGVAQALTAGEERLTRPGAVVGSPQYMSPEQAAGERELDGRSDIYALGLVGYEMLTGEPAFSGTSVVAVLTKQLTEPPPPLAPRAPDAPPAVVAAIMRALEKDADDRWQDASEMARALAGEIPTEPPRQDETSEPIAPPTAPAFGTALHPERPHPRAFVGPGRPPARTGRARRIATWLTAISAVLLFAAPVAWLARPPSTSSGTVDLSPSIFVAPLDVPSLDSAFTLARQAGARTVVVGQVLRGADSLRVVADTYDVATRQRVGGTHRSAPPGADPRLIFDAIARDILSNASPGQPHQTRP